MSETIKRVFLLRDTLFLLFVGQLRRMTDLCPPLSIVDSEKGHTFAAEFEFKTSNNKNINNKHQQQSNSNN